MVFMMFCIHHGVWGPKLSGDGFQFEVLLSWICGGGYLSAKILGNRVFQDCWILISWYIMDPTNSSMSWKNPRWVFVIFVRTVGPKFQCIQVEDKQPKFQGLLVDRKSFIIWKTMTEILTWIIWNLFQKIVWKISAERNKQPKARWF